MEKHDPETYELIAEFSMIIFAAVSWSHVWHQLSTFLS